MTYICGPPELLHRGTREQSLREVDVQLTVGIVVQLSFPRLTAEFGGGTEKPRASNARDEERGR